MDHFLLKAKDKFLLLLFILLFIMIFTTLFGQHSIYIGVFVLTALLMFKEMDLGVNMAVSLVAFPLLFVLVTLVPLVLIKSQSLLLNSFLIISVVLGILFLLSRTLLYQSYIPFLFLFALNHGDTSALAPRLAAAFLGGLLVSLTYWLYRKKRQKNFVVPLTESLSSAFSRQKIFITKLTLGLLAAYLLGTLFTSVKVAWMMLTVISLTQFDFIKTQQRFKHRILGTAIGIVVYFVLITILIPQQYWAAFLLIVSYFYMFITDYLIKMIFITFNALNAAVLTFHFPQTQMLVERLLFILLGAIIAYLLGDFFERYKRSHQKSLLG